MLTPNFGRRILGKLTRSLPAGLLVVTMSSANQHKYSSSETTLSLRGKQGFPCMLSSARVWGEFIAVISPKHQNSQSGKQSPRSCLSQRACGARLVPSAGRLLIGWILSRPAVKTGVLRKPQGCLTFSRNEAGGSPQSTPGHKLWHTGSGWLPSLTTSPFSALRRGCCSSHDGNHRCVSPGPWVSK